MLYKSGNKPTAICSFKHILCKFVDAINELGCMAQRSRSITPEIDSNYF